MSKTVTNSNSVLEDASLPLEIPQDEKAYMHWRKTGELPDSEEGMAAIEERVRKEEEEQVEEDVQEAEKKKVEAKTPEEGEEESEVEEEPSEGEESAASQKKPVTEGAESGAAKPQQKISAKERIRQLNAENKKLREESAKRERELLQKLVDRSQPAAEKKPVTIDAKTGGVETGNPEPQIDDKNEKGEAKYKTWGEFVKAQQKWNREEISRLVKAGLTEGRNQDSVTEAERIVKEGFLRRVSEAEKVHTDFRQVAFNPDLPITKGSPIEQYILESENGTEVLYYLGQHPEEITQLTGLSSDRDEKGDFVRVGRGVTPALLYRQLSLIELSLLPDEEAPPAEQKKPAAKSPVAKPVTKAPPPPRQVSGKSPSNRDEVEEAVEGDDFDKFAQAENAREIARRKAQRARGR